MAKADVKRDTLLEWNSFAGKSADEAAEEIYKHVAQLSQSTRDWYWKSIHGKRMGSTFTRGAGFFLGTIGVVAPLVAAFVSKDHQLPVTQLGVVALAVAASIQLFDKVFGWSSGWLRYTSTVTALEKLTVEFELAWAGYFVVRSGSLSDADKKALFDLATKFEGDIEKQRSDETAGWVNEFNTGTAALNEWLKAQKDVAEKAVETARKAAVDEAQEKKGGAIQLNVTQAVTPPKPVTIYVDDKKGPTFIGSSWGTCPVVPGMHTLRVVLENGSAQLPEATSVFAVPAGGVANVSVAL